MSPGSSASPFHTGHPQTRVLELSRLWWLHIRMSPSYRLLLETVPCPLAGRAGEPQLPGGLGMLSPGGSTAERQLVLSSWMMEKMRRCRSPLPTAASCSPVSPERRKSVTGDIPQQPGAMSSFSGACYQGLVLPEQSEHCHSDGHSGFKASCCLSQRKPALSRARLPAVPPSSESVTRFITDPPTGVS